jgi:hypothetical protein
MFSRRPGIVLHRDAAFTGCCLREQRQGPAAAAAGSIAGAH